MQVLLFFYVRVSFSSPLQAVTAAIVVALVEKRAGPLERLWGESSLAL